MYLKGLTRNILHSVKRTLVRAMSILTKPLVGNLGILSLRETVEAMGLRYPILPFIRYIPTLGWDGF